MEMKTVWVVSSSSSFPLSILLLFLFPSSSSSFMPLYFIFQSFAYSSSPPAHCSSLFSSSFLLSSAFPFPLLRFSSRRPLILPFVLILLFLVFIRLSFSSPSFLPVDLLFCFLLFLILLLLSSAFPLLPLLQFISSSSYSALSCCCVFRE